MEYQMMGSEIRYISRQIVNENVPSANVVATLICLFDSARKKCVVIMKAIFCLWDMLLDGVE
jgi:hypothetical protein